MAFDTVETNSETWQPSVQLRFVERERTADAWMQKSPPIKILQQLWTSSKNNREWRDIPTVKL